MIDVDFSELGFESVFALMTESMAEAVLDDAAESARAKWIRLAQTELGSSAQSYIEGIQGVVAAAGVRTIALVGWLANAVENGLDGFDLRETLLGEGSSIRRKGADGSYYANVPFRHATPGSGGLAGAPMGSSYGPAGTASRGAGGLLSAEKAAQFGKEVYKAAKKLRAKTAKRGAKRMKEGQVRAAFHAAGGKGEPLLKPHHKSSIYAGMRKERKPYTNPRTGKTTTQSQYTTFRRISTSRRDGWRHPGIEPRHLSERVTEHIARIVPGLVQAAVRGGVKK